MIDPDECHRAVDVPDMFEQLLADGWSAAFMTFMFDHMPGGVEARCRQQERLVVEAYARFATRVVRHPTSRSAIGRLPLWIGGPDFPVWKHEKQALRDVTLNDGQHIHMMTATPSVRRFKGDFCSYVEENQQLFTGGPCCRVHAKPITEDLPRVARYLVKSIDRHRVAEDTLIVLPRSPSELRPSTHSLGQKASIFADGTCSGSNTFSLSTRAKK